MSEKEYYSPAEVAKALGVGVTTVKRWVDLQVLPAHKTAGGHRKILRADVIRLARDTNLPLLGLEQCTDQAPDVPTDWTRLSSELFAALRSGNSKALRSILHGSYFSGASIEDLADRIIAPAMATLGYEWELGRLDVMHEHRSSMMCIGVLHELKAEIEVSATKNRPIAVGGNPPGDHSGIASLLIQMLLLDSGWNAVNLGENTPMASYSLALRELHPRMLWISIGYPSDSPTFFEDLHKLQTAAELAGASLALGGRSIRSCQSKLPSGAFIGHSLAELATFARTLNPLPHAPRRGGSTSS